MNKIFIVLISLFAFTSIARAQNSKLDGPFITKRVIKVYGSCEQCKSSIDTHSCCCHGSGGKSLSLPDAKQG